MLPAVPLPPDFAPLTWVLTVTCTSCSGAPAASFPPLFLRHQKDEEPACAALRSSGRWGGHLRKRSMSIAMVDLDLTPLGFFLSSSPSPARADRAFPSIAGPESTDATPCFDDRALALSLEARAHADAGRLKRLSALSSLLLHVSLL